MTSTSFEAFRTCNVLHSDLESDVLTSIAFLCSFEDRDCDHKGLETNFSMCARQVCSYAHEKCSVTGPDRTFRLVS